MEITYSEIGESRYVQNFVAILRPVITRLVKSPSPRTFLLESSPSVRV